MADEGIAYVQVQFENGRRSYTFIDGTGQLQIGDQVQLDPENGDERVVTVVGNELGWDGHLRTITSKPIKVDTSP